MSLHNATTHKGLTFTIEPLTDAEGPLRLVWLHGWRADKEHLRPLAQSLLPLGESWLLNSPAHGGAPLPAEGADCSAAAHAEALCQWLGTLPPCPTVLLGHSMGFRIALHAAAQRAPHVKAIVALAGAGVPKPLQGKAKLRAWWIKQLLTLGHKVQPFVGTRVLDAVRRRYESTDAKSCPAVLKPIFRAIVRDDATPLLPLIEVPALLLYGAEDTDTPPSLGHAMAARMMQAKVEVLPGMNHYTLLTHGRHVVAERLYGFLKGLV